MVEAHRTAIFTLHTPTRHAKAVIEYAFREYEKAYTALLKCFGTCTPEELQHMARITPDSRDDVRTSARKLCGSLFTKNRTFDAIVAPLEASMRESIKMHVAETLLSYAELSAGDVQKDTSYPTRLNETQNEAQRIGALVAFSQSSESKETEATLRNELLRTGRDKKESLPVPFIRIDDSRNCGLFYNEQTKTYYVRLFLLPEGHRQAKPLSCKGIYTSVKDACKAGDTELKRYASLSAISELHLEKGVQYTDTFGKNTHSILVPLEMGLWHEQPLRYTSVAFLPYRFEKNNGAEPVSARLVKYGESYQVHIAFRFPKPERIPAETLLGVDRGILCLAAGAVTSLDTRTILDTFLVEGVTLRAIQRQIEALRKSMQKHGKTIAGVFKQKEIHDQFVHLCANTIIAMALKYRSQIVMEELSGISHREKRKKGKRRSNFNHMLNRRQYQALLHCVEEAIVLTGLPPLRFVQPAFTSQMCSACGRINEKEKGRDKKDRTQFCCQWCGNEAHADVQAGINIARKFLYVKVRGEEKKQGVSEKNRSSYERVVQEILAHSAPQKTARADV